MYPFLFRPVIGLAFALAATAASAASFIQPFEPGSLQQIVDREKGKPFVLIVWSMDCEFCQASLDTLARERQQRKDLRVVTISTDPLADPALTPMVEKRLAALGMKERAWAFGALPPERLRFAIDRNWHGEKPRSYWFKANGEKTAYSGVITPAVIDKLFPH